MDYCGCLIKQSGSVDGCSARYDGVWVWGFYCILYKIEPVSPTLSFVLIPN